MHAAPTVLSSVNEGLQGSGVSEGVQGGVVATGQEAVGSSEAWEKERERERGREYVPLQWLMEGGGEGLWGVSASVGGKSLDLLWALSRQQRRRAGRGRDGLSDLSGLSGERGGESMEQEWEAGMQIRGGTDAGSADTDRTARNSSDTRLTVDAAAASSLMALLAASPVIVQPHGVVRALAAMENWGQQVVQFCSGPSVGSRGDASNEQMSSSGSSSAVGVEGRDATTHVLGGALLLQVRVCVCVSAFVSHHACM